ncbi:Hypothetical predicted protein [Podarcis lilfordi]|uniref:Uncharacterized protein n=1 Tax=Podarcis lilfordi TaxID=74358 RepID=A0AA35PM31_9SAUR|nr:Hypothetical predicted protein [Podarcis lilfordi]
MFRDSSLEAALSAEFSPASEIPSFFQDLLSSLTMAAAKASLLKRAGREPFPNVYFVLAKSLEGRGDSQGHASRDEAPAPAPGMKNQTTSRRFLTDVLHGASPLPFLCVGMALSRPGLAQKQQPKFPPIKTASWVILERGETLAAASVLGQSNARMEEKWGALIRSAREKFSQGTAAFREGLEPRRRPLAPEDLLSAPLWLLPKPPQK